MTCGSRLPCGARPVDLLPLQRGSRLPLRFTTPHSPPARPSFRAVHRSVAFPPLQRGSRPPRPRSTRSRAARMVRDFPLRSGAACVSVRLTFRRASHSAPARLTASVWFTVRRLASAPARLAASVWFRGPVGLLPLQRGLRLSAAYVLAGFPLRSGAATASIAVHGSGRLPSAPASLARLTVSVWFTVRLASLRSGAAHASVWFTAPVRTQLRSGAATVSVRFTASFRSSDSSAAHGFRCGSRLPTPLRRGTASVRFTGPVGFLPLQRGLRLRAVHGPRLSCAYGPGTTHGSVRESLAFT
jgi:hypothetical protein